MSNTHTILLAIKAALEAAVWPGVGGEVVFGKVLVSAGINFKAAKGQLRYPFVRILPDSLAVDDEAEDLITQNVTISVVQQVAADPWGETVLIGGPTEDAAASLTSEGRGLLELETPIFDALKLLSVTDGIAIQFTGASGTAAQLDPDEGYLAQRDYTFEAWTGAGTSP